MKSFERLRKDCEPFNTDTYPISDEAKRAFGVAMSQFIMDDAHGLWHEPESRDGHCDPDHLAYTIGSRLSALQELCGNGRTQSPIEDMLGASLLWLRQDWAWMPEVDYCSGPDELRKTFGFDDSGRVRFYLTPQAEIGEYRADFLVWFQCKNYVAGVAVECDGHAFHEKTKEQAARDKRRDRDFMAAGFPVLRFSGSEIFKDAVGCAEQVSTILSDLLDRVSRDAGVMP